MTQKKPQESLEEEQEITQESAIIDPKKDTPQEIENKKPQEEKQKSCWSIHPAWYASLILALILLSVTCMYEQKISHMQSKMRMY